MGIFGAKLHLDASIKNWSRFLEAKQQEQSDSKSVTMQHAN